MVSRLGGRSRKLIRARHVDRGNSRSFSALFWHRSTGGTPPVATYRPTAPIDGEAPATQTRPSPSDARSGFRDVRRGDRAFGGVTARSALLSSGQACSAGQGRWPASQPRHRQSHRISLELYSRPDRRIGSAPLRSPAVDRQVLR